MRSVNRPSSVTGGAFGQMEYGIFFTGFDSIFLSRSPNTCEPPSQLATLLYMRCYQLLSDGKPSGDGADNYRIVQVCNQFFNPSHNSCASLKDCESVGLVA
jgi:hypothetical protein